MDTPFYGTDGTTHYAFEWIFLCYKTNEELQRHHRLGNDDRP